MIKKQNANIIQIKKRKEDLAKRVEDILPFCSILGDNEKLEISNLKNIIGSIDINSKNKNDINTQLEKLSLQIGKLNRKIALLLPKKLDEQLEQIKQEVDAFEKPLLLKKSEEAKAQNDIELIKDQIKLNTVWLDQRCKLFKALDQNIGQLSECLELEGVNKDLLKDLMSIKNDDRVKPIEEVIRTYVDLEQKIYQINTPISSEVIDSYISSTEKYLKEKVEDDNELSFLLEYMEKIVADKTSSTNLSLLKDLKYIDNEMLVLRNLDKLKSYTLEYKEKHDQIIKENSTLINKKFDKELASFISDNTQDITRNINALIACLYDRFLKNDIHTIAEILKFTNLQGQHAKVLLLLISDMKIKRSLIPGMLGVYGNMNPVISRLINERIRANENLLRENQKVDKEKTVFVHLILRLLE